MKLFPKPTSVWLPFDRSTMLAVDFGELSRAVSLSNHAAQGREESQTTNTTAMTLAKKVVLLHDLKQPLDHADVALLVAMEELKLLKRGGIGYFFSQLGVGILSLLLLAQQLLELLPEKGLLKHRHRSP